MMEIMRVKCNQEDNTVIPHREVSLKVSAENGVDEQEPSHERSAGEEDVATRTRYLYLLVAHRYSSCIAVVVVVLLYKYKYKYKHPEVRYIQYKYSNGTKRWDCSLSSTGK
jgi:hypothetical protein